MYAKQLPVTSIVIIATSYKCKGDMMKNLLTLLKLNFRLMFTPSKRSSKGKELAMKLLWLIILVPMAIGTAISITALAGVVPKESHPQLLTTVIVAVQMIIVFFGSAQYVSMLFFSKDTEMLMAMPIKPQTIFLSKFITIYASYLVLTLIIQLPSTIALGVVGGAGAVYYIMGILAVFFTPAIPLLAISLISIPLAYLAGFLKKSSFISTILAVVAFAGVFGAYLFFVMSLSAGGGGMMDITAITNILDIMSKIVYPNLFLTSAMLGSGMAILSNIAIYLAIIIGALGITYLLSAVMYKNLATRFLEVGVSKSNKIKSNVSTSSIKALVKRDVKNILGESAMSFNFIIGMIMAPLFLVIFNFTTINNSEKDMVQLMLCVMSLFGVIMISSSNYWAILSFSREGKNLGLLKMLPVSGADVLRSKYLISDAYIAVIMILSGIVEISFGMNWLAVLLYMIGGFLVNAGISSFLIERDLKAPKLHWNNLKEIMRNNISGLFGMLLTIPVIILSGVGIFVSLVVSGGVMPSGYVVGAFAFMPMVIIGIIYLVIFRFARKGKLAQVYDVLE